MTLNLEAINKLPQQLKELSFQIDSLHTALLKRPKEKEWLTRKEKAEKENISISMLDKLTRLGKFEKKKIGRKTLIKA